MLNVKVDPPAPIACPIGGRYSFVQIGDEWEKYYTRIRGITERPRHKIDCHEYISEFKSCNDNPRKFYVDAQYCNSVDHNAKPISEYGLYNKLTFCRCSTNEFSHECLCTIECWRITRSAWQRTHVCWLLAGRHEVLYDHLRWRRYCIDISMLGQLPCLLVVVQIAVLLQWEEASMMPLSHHLN